jgi:hypothetical protein
MATQGNQQVVATASNFWDDLSIEINDAEVRTAIPVISPIALPLQTLKGTGAEALAYLAWQIIKTDDKAVIVRALASACSTLLKDSSNFTGSTLPCVPITGLEVVVDDAVLDDAVVATNMVDAEDVTKDEIIRLMSADTDELGAYFGVLFLAANKRITTRNRTAFNEKRVSAATAANIGDATIFVPDSPYLADNVLSKIYAAMLSFSPVKSFMTAKVVSVLNNQWMGPALQFINMFLLLSDTGMSALKIIKEAVIKHPWIRSDFPELAPELYAVNVAQSIIRRAPAPERPFLKAIHGSAFIPVKYAHIENVLGVCKEVLKRTTPSYENYGGGKTTPRQLAHIQSKLDPALQQVSTVAAE